MALVSQSLFLYGFQITPTNQFISFRGTSGGPVLTATLTIGFYSLGDLLSQIVTQLQTADPAHTYFASADRTQSNGTQNRVTIGTTSTYLDLLFGSGNPSNPATLLGYTATDKTGATSYTGTSTAGTALIPTLTGYNYLGPEFNEKVFGAVNVSASGTKEAVVFQIQNFIEVDFKYEPKASVIANWNPFLTWAIQQRAFEFTPEVTSPNTFYNVTLEMTDKDGKGLAYRMPEMLPLFQNFYMTGKMTMRKKV